MNILDNINKFIISPLIYLLIGVAIVVFLWGAVEFIASADNPAKRTEGQQHLLWGIVGLVIIFGVYGILGVVKNTLLDLFK